MALQISKTITGSEPVTLAEAKAYNRVLFSVDDNTIELLITQARETLEQATNLSLVEQTISLTLDTYKDKFRLPYGPIASVTTVTVNTDNVTDDPVSADYISDNGLIKFNGTGTLKAAYNTGGVEFQGLKIAMLEMIAFLYTNRGTASDYPATVKRWILNNTMNFFV
jgi:uncharacterized phiE125 gp8 family phage protein